MEKRTMAEIIADKIKEKKNARKKLREFREEITRETGQRGPFFIVFGKDCQTQEEKNDTTRRKKT